MDVIARIVRDFRDIYVLTLDGKKALCIGDVDTVRELCVKEKQADWSKKLRVLRVPGINTKEREVIIDYIVNNPDGQLDILLKTGSELRDEVEVLRGLGFGGERIDDLQF